MQRNDWTYGLLVVITGDDQFRPSLPTSDQLMDMVVDVLDTDCGFCF
jgi:hypothetical protein